MFGCARDGDARLLSLIRTFSKGKIGTVISELEKVDIADIVLYDTAAVASNRQQDMENCWHIP